MDRARIPEGIRRMRFLDVLGRVERSALSQIEAAELLGVCERTFLVAGEIGIARKARPVCWTLSPATVTTPRAMRREIERMLGLYRELYSGFTVKHFHEHLGKRHNYTLGYTVTKLHLHRAGLVTPAKTRSGASARSGPGVRWWA